MGRNTTLSRYRYEIDDNDGFAIRCWDDENPNELGAPFLLQPEWPDGTPWANHAEAELWAQRLVAMKLDPKSGRPGHTPAEPFIEWTQPAMPTDNKNYVWDEDLLDWVEQS